MQTSLLFLAANELFLQALPKSASGGGGDPDRFHGGVEFFKAGKAPLLILTGGWSPRETKVQLEGKNFDSVTIETGITEKVILVMDLVVNAEEEANAVRALLNQN